MNQSKSNHSYLFLFLTIPSFLFLSYIAYNLYISFQLNCINKEFLTWDPELRFVLTLKMMNFIREVSIHKYILQVLDSPHWPSLRNVMDSIVFSITSPSPIVEVMISFFFFCITPFAILFVFWKEKTSAWLLGALFFMVQIALLQAEPLVLYSFTGMMEVQGAFAFLFVAYYLANYFQKEPFPEDRNLGWKVLLATTFLYHTKYPYGYMLVLSLILLLVALYPIDTYRTGMQFLNLRKTDWYKNPRLYLTIVCILCLLFLPSQVLTGKLPSYLKYLVVVSISLDIFLFFLKTTNTKTNARVFFILKWIVFPILLWMLSQPDRFGSYAGQITHVESQGSNPGQEVVRDLDYRLLFVTEFLLNGFQSFSLSYFIFISNCLLALKGYYDYLKTQKISTSFIFAVLSMLTFLELSLFTTNRLARHTYHLFPTMILTFAIYIIEVSKKNLRMSWVLTVLVAPIILLPFLTEPIASMQKTEICYTGYDLNDYTKPRWFEVQAKERLKMPTVIVNELSPFHVNKADAEYLISWHAYNQRIPVLFDPKRKKKLDSIYKELWVLQENCEASENWKEKKSFFLESGFDFEKSQSFSAQEGCLVVVPRLN